MAATATEQKQDGAPSTDRDEAEASTARDYFRRGWELLLDEPLLVAFRVLGDAFGFMVRPAGLLLVVVLFALGASRAGMQNGSLGELLRVIDSINPGAFIGGLLGIAAVLWLVNLTVDTLVSGGVFETLRHGILDGEVGGVRRFVERMLVGFPKVLGLRVLAAAAETTVALVGLSTAVAVASAFSGGLARAGLFTQALFIAVPAFVFLSLVILVRLTLLVAVAPLFLRDMSVGDAIAEAAVFIIEHIAPVYRLIVFAASLMLVPLIAYWAFLMAGNLAGATSPYAPLFSAGQIIGQIVLVASLSVIAVLFNAALFAYYGEAAQMDVASEVEHSATQAPTIGPTSTGGTYSESTKLADLLPTSSDRIATLSDFPGFDESDDDRADGEDSSDGEDSGDAPDA